jgi:hypothetical protein
MKTIYLIFGFLISVMMISCDLDRIPEDTMSPETFFSSESELELWTNYFYNQFDNAESLTGLNADDNIDNALGDLMMGQRSPFDESGWSWSMLRSINYYLQNSSNCDDEEVRKSYDGVAYFFRAYFYFNKVRRYGDVPWYNQVLTSADAELLFQPRDDRALVMDSVISDLDKAIEMLPTTKSAERVTKWTALALKSRVALYEGTFRKYHGLSNSEKYLNHAVDASAEFIQSNQYSIYNTGSEPYRFLFNDAAKSRNLTSEVILWKVHSTAANLMNGIQFNISNSRQAFTRRFVNHYLMADGTPYTDQEGWETKLFTEEVSDRDPRLAQTILTPGYIQTGETTPTVNLMNSHTGYQPIKFVAEEAYDGANKGVINFAYFRSAEVLLNYAEAKAELGTITQNDLDISINKLRTRAGMPSLSLAAANGSIDPLMVAYYPSVTTSAHTGVILEIRRERTIELAMEGFRQWDLLRWKEGAAFADNFEGIYFPGPGEYDMDGDGTSDLLIYEDAAGSFGGKKMKLNADIFLSSGTSGFVTALIEQKMDWNEGRDYLWPIPASERVLTGGKLTQNPGWSDGLSF